MHEFMLSSKGVTYLLMGGGLIAIGCFWRYLVGRDEPIRKA